MITVTISKSRLDELGQDVHRSIWTGIPALGAIWPIGVADGVLTARSEGGALVYEWDGEVLEDLA